MHTCTDACTHATHCALPGPAGQYLYAPSGACSPCPRTAYCPGDSRRYWCPRNTKTVATSSGATALSDCLALAGYWGAPEQEAAACVADTFCPVNSTTPRACPKFTTSPPMSTKLRDCVALPGYYTSAGAKATLCPAGHYCPVRNALLHAAHPCRPSQPCATGRVPDGFACPSTQQQHLTHALAARHGIARPPCICKGGHASRAFPVHQPSLHPHTLLTWHTGQHNSPNSLPKRFRSHT